MDKKKERDKKLKDLILIWLFEKNRITCHYIDKDNVFCFIIDDGSAGNLEMVQGSFSMPVMIYDFKSNLLDLLLEISKKGYDIVLSVLGQYDRSMFIQAFSTFEQLAIDYDLNKKC